MPLTLHQLKTQQAKELKELKNSKLPSGKGAKKQRKLELAQLAEAHNAAIEAFKNGQESEEGKEADAAQKEAEAEAQARVEAKRNKKLKKQADKAEQEKLREAEVKAEVSKMVDHKAVELSKIIPQLEERKLSLLEIKGDGQCMFRSLNHQLVASPYVPINADDKHDPPTSIAALRAAASEYLRAHPDDFAAFMMNDDNDMMSPEEYSAYCTGLLSDDPDTLIWGGNAELVALAHVLRRKIIVISAATKPHVFEPSKASPSKDVILTFHRHYYSLGEHYNSVQAVE